MVAAGIEPFDFGCGTPVEVIHVIIVALRIAIDGPTVVLVVCASESALIGKDRLVVSRNAISPWARRSTGSRRLRRVLWHFGSRGALHIRLKGLQILLDIGQEGGALFGRHSRKRLQVLLDASKVIGVGRGSF